MLDAATLGNIGTGVQIAGGIKSLFGGGDDFSRKDAVHMMKAQHSIQSAWNMYDAQNRPSAMVQGAKKAGIHPALLFGSSAMSTPTWSIGGYSGSGERSDNSGYALMQMGQDISRAAFARMSQEERAQELAIAKERQDELDRLNLEKHKADLTHMNMQNAYLASQIKRLEAQFNPPAPSSTSDVVVTPYDPNKQTGTMLGRWELEPAKVTSADNSVPSLTAGPPQPGFTKYRFGGPNIGTTIELPAGSSMSEALESMGGAVAPLYVWGHNIARWLDKKLYGPNGKLLPRKSIRSLQQREFK